MVTAMARPPASRRLRSRIRWLKNEGPTPRPAAAGSGLSIASSLLGFDDFGADAIDQRPAAGSRALGVLLLPGVDDFIGFEQQILALVRRRRVRRIQEIALRAGAVAGGEARHRHPARLPAVLLRVEAMPLL